MRALKWTLLGVVIVVLLVIGSVGLIVATLDPNDYKEQISSKVEELTGRQLALDGDIQWSIFPWLGLNLGQSSLSNADGFGAQPFASLKEIDVQVALMPLLKKQVVARNVVLNGVTLNLQKNAQGKDNWSDLVEQGETKSQSTSDIEEAPADDKGALDIDIRGIEIVDANLSYDDQQSGQQFALSALNVSTSALKMAEPVKLVSDFDVKVNELAIEVEMAGELNLNPEGEVYSVEGLVIRQRLIGDAIPGGQQSAVARLDVDVNTNTQVVNVETLNLELLGLVLEGKFQLSQYLDNLRYQGELASNTFNLSQLMSQLGQVLPVTQDRDLLGATSIKLDMSGDANSLSVKPLIFKLDKSRLEGLVSVANFSQPKITFDLAVDSLDVDGYFPEPSETPADPVASEMPVGGGDAIALPIEMLRSLNIDGQLRVDQLTASKLLFQKANVTLKANGGHIQVAPLRADAYGGAAVINASLDVRGKTPVYKGDVNMSGVQSGDVLQALFNDPLVSGSATLMADVKTSGDAVSALKRGLNGTLQTKFSDGTIKGSKLSAKIIEARNFVRKLEGKSPLENKITDGTKFSVLSATADVAGGVLTNKDLSLVAPLFQASGEGVVDLAKETVDYTLGLGRPPKEGKESFFVPLKVSGPFSDLSFKLALDDVAKDFAKEELRQKEAELKAKANAEKARLKKKADAEKEKLKAEAEAKKAELKAKADQKVEEQKSKLEDQLKKELGDKLQNLLK